MMGDENFIPNVGTIDDFMLKNLLLKNPVVKKLLSDEEYAFLKNPKTDVIMSDRKPFNSIVTDGKREFEIDLKANKLVKPLKTARPKIISHYSTKESNNFNRFKELANLK